jgi:Na+-translocating ferredoxin:NAD+ oxidoreductase RnfC subunit
MSEPCPGCGCTQDDADSLATHALVAALADDDIDRAIASGLLGPLQCDACTAACKAILVAARAQRVSALAARERYRARNARLQQRMEARATRRNPIRADNQPTANPSTAKTALPTAAAAALARAKAKAAERGRP